MHDFDQRERTPQPSILLQKVAAAIAERQLSLGAAAAAIGVSVGTLQNHLRGEHVRSDSIRKYEDWLAGRSSRRKVFRDMAIEQDSLALAEPEAAPLTLPPAPAKPHLVVDIFAGCGGLSLGFDLLGGGSYFETILAMDVQPATVTVLNRNFRALTGAQSDVARLVDMTEFMNETEVLAFYMEHIVRLRGDKDTQGRLHRLAAGVFPRFLAGLYAVDAAFMAELGAVRETPVYRAAYDKLDRQSLLQTSVAGWHDRLKLPRTARNRPTMPPVLWADVANRASGPCAAEASVPDHFVDEARQMWRRELEELERKEAARGTGQLTSSARRIASFVAFARSVAYADVEAAWCRWQAARLALRAETFGNDAFGRELRALYEDTYPVAVLLGGPPCQGFSRIGRGKIRSLREARVHVHGDSEAGDSRNLLYQQYLLVVSALRPLAFKFENVQHFQSTVKADGREFLASEVLAEAIAAMSADEAAYAVSSRTIDASKHGVPQTRQRFLMSGLRKDVFASADAELLARQCLTLPTDAEVPLSVALSGLPEPYQVGGDKQVQGAMSQSVTVADPPASDPRSIIEEYRAWIRQRPLHGDGVPDRTDAHAARSAREDDAHFFSLMGPGKRWMDYRVDDAPTLAKLRETLGAVLQAAEKAELGVPVNQVREMISHLDGSLALRLVLEQIGERVEAPHHLAVPTYLSKRDGNHGDWLARLDGSRPCKTIVAHMAKDSYSYIHPYAPRSLSVREAARVQAFPDWYSFGDVGLTDALRMIGNAVPPLLSNKIAARVASALAVAMVGAATGDGQSAVLAQAS